MLEVSLFKVALIAPAILAMLIAPIFVIDFSRQLWIPLPDPSAESESRNSYERISSEAVLYAQPRLLDEALRAVEPGKPGIVELFYVGFAALWPRAAQRCSGQFDPFA
jgi:hypothetical protein